MTQPGTPEPFPGFPPAPPAKNRTGLMVVAVIAAVAVITALVITVLVTTRPSPSQSASAPGSSTDATTTPSAELTAVRISSPKLITKPGSSEPMATLTLYEDFLCPVCGGYEKVYGPTVASLIDSGQIAVDYKIVSVLGRHSTKSYSVRAGAMAYCVADNDKDAFRRFHQALFADQPDEGGSTFPSDDQLLAQAREAGAGDSVAGCVRDGTYLDMVNTGAYTSGIEGTPTIELNGKDISEELMAEHNPQTLIDKVNSITGSKQ